MSKTDLIASVLAILFVVVIRAFWLGSSTASAAGLGRLPMFPKSWRRWLLGKQSSGTAVPRRS